MDHAEEAGVGSGKLAGSDDTTFDKRKMVCRPRGMEDATGYPDHEGWKMPQGIQTMKNGGTPQISDTRKEGYCLRPFVCLHQKPYGIPYCGHNIFMLTVLASLYPSPILT